MFLCDYCREHALENNGVGIMKSRGACEACKYYDVCTDVHGYQFKPDWEKFVYKEQS